MRTKIHTQNPTLKVELKDVEQGDYFRNIKSGEIYIYIQIGGDDPDGYILISLSDGYSWNSMCESKEEAFAHAPEEFEFIPSIQILS